MPPVNCFHKKLRKAFKKDESLSSTCKVIFCNFSLFLVFRAGSGSGMIGKAGSGSGRQGPDLEGLGRQGPDLEWLGRQDPDLQW